MPDYRQFIARDLGHVWPNGLAGMHVRTCTSNHTFQEMSINDLLDLQLWPIWRQAYLTLAEWSMSTK